MHLPSYLARIGLAAPPAPDLAGLTVLHRAHLMAVPFENLEVQLGRSIGTAIAPIFDKIVGGRRGGWCYEMNGVVGGALSEMGFRVSRLAGAVMRAAKGEAAVGNHLVLRVDLEDGPVFAEVGFGSGPLFPFRPRAGAFASNGFRYALSQPDANWWRLAELRGDTEFSYDVRMEPADEALLARQCRWLQTDSSSPFVQNLVVQKHTPDGLSILRGRVLKHFAQDGALDERLVDSAADLLDVLKRHFDLDVPEAAGLWPKIVARHEDMMRTNMP
jgi:N-hydroxyarylamine O-acetyltransferase